MGHCQVVKSNTLLALLQKVTSYLQVTSNMLLPSTVYGTLNIATFTSNHRHLTSHIVRKIALCSIH